MTAVSGKVSSHRFSRGARVLPSRRFKSAPSACLTLAPAGSSSQSGLTDNRVPSQDRLMSTSLALRLDGSRIFHHCIARLSPRQQQSLSSNKACSALGIHDHVEQEGREGARHESKYRAENESDEHH